MWWKQNEEKPLNIPTDILLSCLIPSCWMPSGAASFLGIIPKMLEFVNLFNNYCSEFLYSFCQINPPFLFLWSVSCFPFELWCQNFTFFFTCCNECLRGNNDYHLSYVHLSLFSCLFFISCGNMLEMCTSFDTIVSISSIRFSPAYCFSGAGCSLTTIFIAFSTSPRGNHVSR